jgi:hypothetical protein
MVLQISSGFLAAVGHVYQGSRRLVNCVSGEEQALIVGAGHSSHVSLIDFERF